MSQSDLDFEDDDEGWETLGEMMGDKKDKHTLGTDEMARMVFQNENHDEREQVETGWDLGWNSSTKDKLKDTVVQNQAVSDATGVVIGKKVMVNGYHCWKVTIEECENEEIVVGICTADFPEDLPLGQSETLPSFGYTSSGQMVSMGNSVRFGSSSCLGKDAQVLVELDLEERTLAITENGWTVGKVELDDEQWKRKEEKVEIEEEDKNEGEEKEEDEAEEKEESQQIKESPVVEWRPAVFVRPTDTVSIEWIESTLPPVPLESYPLEEQVERLKAELEIATGRITELEQTVSDLRDENSQLKVDMCILEEQMNE